MDIIVVGQQAWDTEIGSNCKNIAIEFSKKNRVLYVNPPLDRITSYRNRTDAKVQKRLKVISGDENGLVKISDNLYNLYPDCLIESINWIKNNGVFDFFNKRNNRKISVSIKNALKTLNFSDYILFNDNDIFRSLYLKELIRPILSVYYSRDNMVATDYWKRHGLVFEPKLIAKSDLCLANSEYLKNYCKQFNSNSFYVGQGCDFSIYGNQNELEEVDEIKHLTGPIIGYVGVLTSARLDVELIGHIAINRPNWNVVLVGPEDECFKNSSLHDLSNVYFLGSRQPEDLPKYINSFDVCINPQVLNDLTIGNYPRKIDEYLALGKPTVATRTESMSVFKEHVTLVNDQTEYLDAIEELLKNNSDDLIRSRKDFALSHTWENSVGLIYNAMANSLNH